MQHFLEINWFIAEFLRGCIKKISKKVVVENRDQYIVNHPLNTAKKQELILLPK